MSQLGKIQRRLERESLATHSLLGPSEEQVELKLNGFHILENKLQKFLQGQKTSY